MIHEWQATSAPPDYFYPTPLGKRVANARVLPHKSKYGCKILLWEVSEGLDLLESKCPPDFLDYCHWAKLFLLSFIFFHCWMLELSWKKTFVEWFVGGVVTISSWILWYNLSVLTQLSKECGVVTGIAWFYIFELLDNTRPQTLAHVHLMDLSEWSDDGSIRKEKKNGEQILYGGSTPSISCASIFPSWILEIS